MERKKDEKYLNFPIRYFKECSFDSDETGTNRFDEVICEILGFGVATLINAKAFSEPQALTYLGLSTDNLTERNRHFYLKGKAYCAKIREQDTKTVYSNVKVSLILRLWASEKSHFEIMCFCAYCAVRSWVGQQPFKFMKGNDILLSRIFGFEKVEEYRKKFEKLPKYKQKFTTRYQLDKVKNELELHYGVANYGLYCRGFYLSTKLDIYALGQIAEEQRESNKLKALKGVKRDIYRNSKK